MEEYFNSKKYIILLVTVCLLFTIIALKAFDYMPKPLDDEELNKTTQTTINDNRQSDNNIEAQDSENDIDDDNEEDIDEENADEEEDNENTTNIDNNHKSGHIQFTDPSYPDLSNIEEINAPKGTYEENIEAKY